MKSILSNMKIILDGINGVLDTVKERSVTLKA